jgi:hypothetical protein
MSEFDSLFGCTWRGEAPVEALADWLLQKLETPNIRYRTTYEYIDDFEYYTDPETREVEKVRKVETAELLVYSAGPSSHITVRFRELRLGMEANKHIPRSEWAQGFPKWLQEQIDFLYYVLSK